MKGMLVECERVNLLNSVVVYIKAPYEMADNVIASALTAYGTVTNIRQVHSFDENVETGVRSLMMKNLKHPIPSFLRIGSI